MQKKQAKTKPVKVVGDRFGLMEAIYNCGESGDLLRLDADEGGSGYLHFVSAKTGKVLETLIVEARKVEK